MPHDPKSPPSSSKNSKSSRKYLASAKPTSHIYSDSGSDSDDEKPKSDWSLRRQNSLGSVDDGMMQDLLTADVVIAFGLFTLLALYIFMRDTGE